MNEDITPTSQPEFDNPPINEVVCGIRFKPLDEFRATHFGRLWEKFRHDFPVSEDRLPFAPLPEEVSADKLQLPRVWFIHKDENEIIQVQRDWFLHNWRKNQEHDEYPHFEKIIKNFEKYLSYFEEFLTEEKLDAIVPQQYQLTYIDLVPKGQGWESLSEVGNVFPDFISLPSTHALFSNTNSIALQVLLALPDEASQLQMTIRDGIRRSDNQLTFYLDLTARGEALDTSHESLRNWFERAHEWILQLFLEITGDEIQDKYWGRKKC